MNWIVNWGGYFWGRNCALALIYSHELQMPILEFRKMDGWNQVCITGKYKILLQSATA